MMTKTRAYLPKTHLFFTTNFFPALPLQQSTVPSRIHHTILHVLVIWLLATIRPSETVMKTERTTRYYPMTRPACGNVYRNVPGAMLEGGKPYGKAPPRCDVTFLSTVDNPAWMIRFEKYVIRDCTVFITILDSSLHPTNQPFEFIRKCMDSDPGVIFINSTSVTVRLQHKNATDYTFLIAITAISTDHYDSECAGFTCDNGVCIPKSLLCDDADNCFDGSDESKNGTSMCYDSIWPLQGENWGVLASVLGVGLVLGVMAACCRHLKRKRQSTIDDLYDLNEGPYVHKYAYRYAIIRPPKKPNKTKVVLGRDGHMHYTTTNV